MDKYEKRAGKYMNHRFPYTENASFERVIMEHIIDAYRFADAEREKETCEWKDDGEGNYETACGEMATIIEGHPKENKMTFCWYCGHRIKEVE